MKQYRILIDERNYSSWIFQNIETNIFVDNTEELLKLKHINPIECKLFSNDLINDKGEIIHSYVRTCQSLAGVLLLEENKTFGRTQTRKKLLYKCVPDDKRLPVFLVPYEVSFGFSKNIINKYVVFQFNKWVNKHPEGLLTDVLGDVDKLDVFYEYQLYCRNLHVSMTNFNKKVHQTFHKEKQQEHIEKILKNSNYEIENRVKSHTVYTIDPKTSMDYDDGFSIKLLSNSEENGERKWNISIYIANVFFWLETFDLWKSFSKRVSTIYLPEQRRPMIPTILSDNLCSLLENQNRFAFCIDLEIIENDNKVIINEDAIRFKSVLINIAKNYEYEEAELLENLDYINLLNLTKKKDKNVSDSHDVISYWMTYTNRICAEKLANKKTGIFRSTVCSQKKNKKQILNISVSTNLEKNDDQYNILNIENNHFSKKENDNFEKLNKETKRLIENWNNISGKYIVFSENALLKHELLDIDCYAHITSPIRRLVDLLNQIIFFEKYRLVKKINNETKSFVENWLSQIEYINVSMRSIRKIQTDCEMIRKVSINPVIMENIYEGTIFDKIKKNNGLFSFMVYLHDLKLLSRIVTTEEIENNSIHNFKLYFFGDEYNYKKKIKLMIYTL